METALIVEPTHSDTTTQAAANQIKSEVVEVIEAALRSWLAGKRQERPVDHRKTYLTLLQERQGARSPLYETLDILVTADQEGRIDDPMYIQYRRELEYRVRGKLLEMFTSYHSIRETRDTGPKRNPLNAVAHLTATALLATYELATISDRAISSEVAR